MPNDVKLHRAADLTLEYYIDGSGHRHGEAEIFRSEEGTSEPLTAGLLKMEKSDRALRFDYSFDEAKYVIDGEVTVVDLSTGHEVKARQGDFLSFQSGASTEWYTESSCTIFYVSATAEIGPAWVSERPLTAVADH